MKILFKINNFRQRRISLWLKKLRIKKLIRPTLTLLFICFFAPLILSQVFSEKDIEICDSKFQLAIDENLAEKPIGEVIVEIGKSFIGTDYLAHSLEIDGEEQLVVNLSRLDCTTFVEYSLAISRCIKKGTTSFDDFIEELQFIRYRDGVINGYTSRLHYFSDWITNNIAKGVVEDVTMQMGGKPIKFLSGLYVNSS